MRCVKKVSIVTPFYPPDPGGIAVHVHELANRLTKLGVRCQVISCFKGFCSSSFHEKVNEKLEVIRVVSATPIHFPETMKSFRIPFYSTLIRDELLSFDPDVIHLHGHHYPISWLIAFDQKMKNIPKILTMHGMYALNPYQEGGKSVVEGIFNQSLLRVLLKKINGIIALTPTMAKYISKYTDRPIFVIPNGVDLELFQKNLKKKYEYRNEFDLPQDKKIVLFRGRFNYVKGIVEYTYVAALLSRLRKGLYFLAVGDGSYSQFVKEMFEKYIDGCVMSWTPYEHLHKLYIASDIYVLPSKWEALPITLIEAMASELVIVATGISTIVDVLRDYPKKVLIERSTVRDLFNGIKKALLLNQYDYIDRNKLYKYDWKQIIGKIYRLYCIVSSRC